MISYVQPELRITSLHKCIQVSCISVPHRSFFHCTLAPVSCSTPALLYQIGTSFLSHTLLTLHFVLSGLVVCKYIQQISTTMLPGMVQSKYTTYWQVLLAPGAVCMWNSNWSEVGFWPQRTEVKKLCRLLCFSWCREQGLSGTSDSFWHCPFWTKVVKLQCLPTGLGCNPTDIPLGCPEDPKPRRGLLFYVCFIFPFCQHLKTKYLKELILIFFNQPWA